MTLNTKRPARCPNSGQQQAVSEWAEATEVLCVACGQEVAWAARSSDLPPMGKVGNHRTDGNAISDERDIVKWYKLT